MRKALADAMSERVVLLDGGLATRLEAQGCDLSGGLWSGRVLLEDPEQVSQAHAAFARAGAEVLTTASYQVSAMSLERSGQDPALEATLLRRSVDVARQVRDEVAPGGWVAGSVGAYGASLADGSEYTGEYDLGDATETVRALRAFHRPRMEALLDAGADVLACETIPRLAEVSALAAELTGLGAPAWISLTVTTDRHGKPRTCAGEPLADVAGCLAGVPGLVAVGVNCCRPRDVRDAVRVLTEATGLPGVAYPNSGEGWDARTQRWTGRSEWHTNERNGDPDDDTPAAWVAAGARLVGGCCRVTPWNIRSLGLALLREGGATHAVRT
ncbi:MAG TPA: homocysteine S-methyltransferase [Actinomycetales bacterium]|nr:homocysteine S-methyltransferase [Actinomycetales bacterium]